MTEVSGIHVFYLEHAHHKRFRMAAVLHYGVFVLLLVAGIGGAKVTRMTADELFSSALWEDASKSLLILGEGNTEPPLSFLVARDILLLHTHTHTQLAIHLTTCQLSDGS